MNGQNFSTARRRNTPATVSSPGVIAAYPSMRAFRLTYDLIARHAAGAVQIGADRLLPGSAQPSWAGFGRDVCLASLCLERRSFRRGRSKRQLLYSVASLTPPIQPIIALNTDHRHRVGVMRC
jgi:hypothetical protein